MNFEVACSTTDSFHSWMVNFISGFTVKSLESDVDIYHIFNEAHTSRRIFTVVNIYYLLS